MRAEKLGQSLLRLRRTPGQPLARIDHQHAVPADVDHVARQAHRVRMSHMGGQAHEHFLCAQRLDNVVDAAGVEAPDNVAGLRV